MNFLLSPKLLLAAGLVVCCARASDAQGISTTQLLSGGQTCHHVIQLIHRHGVNNSFDTSGGSMIAGHFPIGPMSIPLTELGDLEILQVSQVDQVDDGCGPSFHVTIRNNSTRKVCNFHVTMVAVLGRICPTSPTTTVKVGEICPGEALEVCVQLPIESLAMGNRNGQVIGFQRLVVAIDSYDQLVESNEANNLKAYACAEIPMVSTVVESTTTVTEQNQVTVREQAGSAAQAGATVQADPAAAAPQASPAPAPETSAKADPLRAAIQMLGDQDQQSASKL